jgi:hypothetical protein
LVTPAGILLDSNIVISYASYIQENPRVAFDGTNYLVVWQDHRNRFYDEDSIDIYGARVDQSGAVLDTAGIVICRTQFQQTNPDVAFDGMNYFAVWQDWYVNGYGIRGTRISQAGHVIDTTFILLSGDGHAPQISFDGENYLVVWQRYPPGSWHRDIYGVRIDTAGVLVDSFPISTGAGSQLAPTLTHGASNQIFVALSGWTDSINSQSANTMRIWGKFYPFIGVEKDRVLGLKETGMGLQVYPNPFNNLVNIRYSSVANIETVELKIYDVSGRLLKEFFEPSPSAGIESSITWDGTDQAKRQVPSGVYFLELQSGNYSSTRKLLLIR